MTAKTMRRIIADGSSPGFSARALRRKVDGLALKGFYEGLSRVTRLSPRANPKRYGIEVQRDIPYIDSGRREHLLDVYHPPAPSLAPALPVVVYVHGGGFQMLSKDSHWIMGLAFARQGYLVFNINYRLAPRHRFPAGLQDVAAAYKWVIEHAREYGGDPSRLVLAGESAGANLVTALTVATCYERKEPFAEQVYSLGVTPRVTLPACGMLQATDPQRFARRKRLSSFVAGRLEAVTRDYLPRNADPTEIELADPLVVLERAAPPDRALPPFFAAIGTRDPLLDDSRRLGLALERLGVPCDVRVYPGEIHAFHALVWRPAAKQCWQDTFAFLDTHLD